MRMIVLMMLGAAWAVGLQSAWAEDPPAPADAPPAEPLDRVPPPADEPSVSIRTIENGDTVEEYRVNGRLSMVKVRPRGGVPYTLIDTNGDGRLDRKDSEGPVAPVYWTLYEWN